MIDPSGRRAPGVRTGDAVRWHTHQVTPEHSLPLGRVLALLAVGDERVAVGRMLDLLRSTIGAGAAAAVEYVLHGGVLKARQVVELAAAGDLSVDGSIADAAHAHLLALARGNDDDVVVGLRGPADEAGTRERVSVLYTLAPNTAWAMHFLPGDPAAGFALDVLALLSASALFAREVHRIVSATAAEPGERIDAAAIRLGVRATALSGRERQICARIAGGRSAASIAAELGIAASTVMTLRKRAYAKLGIHDRRDLRHLAA